MKDRTCPVTNNLKLGYTNERFKLSTYVVSRTWMCPFADNATDLEECTNSFVYGEKRLVPSMLLDVVIRYIRALPDSHSIDRLCAFSRAESCSYLCRC